MKESEFDKFAEEYYKLHKANTRLTGEEPEYFAEYKINDLARHVKSSRLNPRRLLDFGCGVGNSVPYIKKFFPESNLICLDVSQKSLDICEERFPGEADCRVFDGANIPIEEDSIDVVFSACVFHHIPLEFHVPLLTEIYRILAPGGMVFIYEHNPYNPLTVRAVNTCPFDENAHLITAKELKNKFIAAGFEDPKIEYRVFFPKFLAFMRKTEKYLMSVPLGAQYSIKGKKLA